MKNRVLLLGGNFSPELTGIGKYNGEMMQWLSDKGFECTVITTYPYYPEWKVQTSYSKRSYWFKNETKATASASYNIIRCPHYVPKNPTGAKRLASDLTIFFSTFIALLPLLFKKKHDYVLTVAPPFALGVLGIFYKKLKGAKFLYHIQDLQVDAARDLNLIRSKPMLDVLFSIENFILRHADVMSTISKGMIRKMNNKCNGDVVLFPNWVDLEEFYPIINKRGLKVQYGFKASDKVILYSGAIGEKQGLESIIHSAKFFEKKPDVKFVICGSGPYKKQLVALQERLNLKNVFFLPLQPAESFNQFLNMADVHLILQKANASDLVLPSKLSTIMAIGGVSIVTAKCHSSLYEIMAAADMGIVIEPEDQVALDNAITEAIISDLAIKGLNARLYAERHLSIDAILKAYSERALDHRNFDTPKKARKVLFKSPKAVSA